MGDLESRVRFLVLAKELFSFRFVKTGTIVNPAFHPKLIQIKVAGA
jgi:hypothetical protein